MLSHDFVKAFADTRHPGLSFPYLKENGELLSIAASSNIKMAPESLDLYTDFYENILSLIDLYPPFFRFFLAIALDLEALGMPGNKGEILSDYVLKKDLYAQETSDTRRLEILNLLARTGREPDFHSDSRANLERRVQGFLNAPDRFVKFNRPFFYDLTHIIFFMTNYGKIEIDYSEALIQSLTNIGLLAFLDDDFDLLAEICLCFLFLGEEAPSIWQIACETAFNDLTISYQEPQSHSSGSIVDEYHIYFVINWLMKFSGKAAFPHKLKSGIPVFSKPQTNTSALASLSHKLHPLMLSKTKKQIVPPLNVKSFLCERQNKQIELALVSSPFAPEFFRKHTHGHVSLA